MSGKLRTEELEQIYREFRQTEAFNDGCVLCKEEPLELFTFWKIIINKFPYDRIASTHHMIVPLEHSREIDLSLEAKEEFARIKETLGNYDFFMEPLEKGKSIPNHFHIHLVKIKKF